MDSRQAQHLMESFEAAKLLDVGGEVWSARELMALLGYADWKNFKKSISKAITDAITYGIDPITNFVESRRVGPPGSKNTTARDFRLTRGAAYLVALNSDPAHDAVAFARVYFVIQTKTSDIIQQSMMELFGNDLHILYAFGGFNFQNGHKV